LSEVVGSHLTAAATVCLIPSLWLGTAGKVHLGNYAGDQHGSCSCLKNSLSQGLAIKITIAKYGPVFGLLGILDGTPHYTCLSNEEWSPDLYHAAYNIFSTSRGMTVSIKNVRFDKSMLIWT
jgi:hypothetical protein